MTNRIEPPECGNLQEVWTFTLTASIGPLTISSDTLMASTGTFLAFNYTLTIIIDFPQGPVQALSLPLQQIKNLGPLQEHTRPLLLLQVLCHGFYTLSRLLKHSHNLYGLVRLLLAFTEPLQPLSWPLEQSQDLLRNIFGLCKHSHDFFAFTSTITASLTLKTLTKHFCIRPCPKLLMNFTRKFYSLYNYMSDLCKPSQGLYIKIKTFISTLTASLNTLGGSTSTHSLFTSPPGFSTDALVSKNILTPS